MTSLPSYSEALYKPGGYFDWLKRQAGVQFNAADTGFGRVLALALPSQAAATIALGLTDWPTLMFQPRTWEAVSSVEWNGLCLATDHIVIESATICWPDTARDLKSASIAMWIPTSPAGKLAAMLAEVTAPFRNWRLQSAEGNQSIVVRAIEKGEFPISPWSASTLQ